MITTKERFEIDYIDASGASCFNRCPAKFMFSRLMGLTSTGKSMVAPDYGTAMHRALPYCYDGLANVERAIDEFNAAWKEYDYGISDEKRNPTCAEASLRNFANCRDKHTCPYTIVNMPVKVTTADIISPNELPFMVDIGGKLPIAGRIDAPVRWKQTGKLWTMDYKTSSEVSSRFFNNFNRATQSCLYVFALSVMSGEPVEGMIIEAVRTSKKNVECQAAPIFVSNIQIEQCIEMVNESAEAMIKCNEEQKWPQRLTGCSPYSMFEGQPGRVCEFAQICDAPDWETMVKYYVRSKPFHPFKVR